MSVIYPWMLTRDERLGKLLAQIMKSISPKLQRAFTQAPDREGVTQAEGNRWLKWARLYIDFSLKYGHRPRSREVIPLFLEKLESKGQSAHDRAEAGRAVNALLDVLATFPEPGAESVLTDEPHRPQNNVPAAMPPDHDGNQSPHAVDGASTTWEVEYEKLANQLAVGQYALTTRKSYTGWVRQFQGFLRSSPPGEVDSADAAAFLTFLAVEKNVAASTQNQAFNALLFFFRKVLDVEFEPDGVRRARRTKYVPQTLTREEVDRIVEAMPARYALLTRLLYGCGLRLNEAVELRVHNLDFDLGILTIHRGKGQKDRTVPLPEVMIDDLKSHLDAVRRIYESDLEKGYAGAFMPARGSKTKWRGRATQWPWQFFFPAARLTHVAKADEFRRYHLHPNRFGEHLRKVVGELGITKRVTAHTFRHSFASHLLLANYDIRTIQEMLGHGDVRTTMIYLQTVPSRTEKGRKSPLDLPPCDIAPKRSGEDLCD